jgi:hypothetical protein
VEFVEIQKSNINGLIFFHFNILGHIAVCVHYVANYTDDNKSSKGNFGTYPTCHLLCFYRQFAYSLSNMSWVMGGACSTYGRKEKRAQGFGGETRVKEPTWETQA